MVVTWVSVAVLVSVSCVVLRVPDTVPDWVAEGDVDGVLPDTLPDWRVPVVPVVVEDEPVAEDEPVVDPV
jgi:hypothetical protein